MKYANRIWASPALTAHAKADIELRTSIRDPERAGAVVADFDTNYAFVRTICELLEDDEDIRIDVTRFLPPRHLLRRCVRALARGTLRGLDAELRTRAWYRSVAAQPWTPSDRGAGRTSSTGPLRTRWFSRDLVTVVPAVGSQRGAVIKHRDRFWTRNARVRSHLQGNVERLELTKDDEFVRAVAGEPPGPCWTVWRTRRLPPVVVIWTVVRDRVYWWWITGPRELPGLVWTHVRWFPYRPPHWGDDAADAQWWSAEAGLQPATMDLDEPTPESEPTGPDDVLDDHFDGVLEGVYVEYKDDPPSLRAPGAWLQDLIATVGLATSAAGAGEWSRALHDVITTALGAMDAHSIAAFPGEPTGPESLLGLTCIDARMLIREKGWFGGEREVWCARIGEQLGQYCAHMRPYLEESDEGPPIQMAGPAAMGIAAAAMLAAAASSRADDV